MEHWNILRTLNINRQSNQNKFSFLRYLHIAHRIPMQLKSQMQQFQPKNWNMRSKNTTQINFGSFKIQVISAHLKPWDWSLSTGFNTMRLSSNTKIIIIKKYGSNVFASFYAIYSRIMIHNCSENVISDCLQIANYIHSSFSYHCTLTLDFCFCCLLFFHLSNINLSINLWKRWNAKMKDEIKKRKKLRH